MSVRKMLLHNKELDTDIIVDVPFGVPEMSVGTKVTAKIPDPEDKEQKNKYEVEGQIVGIQTTTNLNTETGEVTTMTIYTLFCPDFSEEFGTVEALEEEILFFIPTTNEFSAEYYNSDNEDDEQEVTDENQEQEERGPVSEADLQASQERAAGYGTSGRYGGGVDI